VDALWGVPAHGVGNFCGKALVMKKHPKKMSADQFPRPANFPYTDVFYFDGSVAMMLGVYKD
jgi:hypothetical protein